MIDDMMKILELSLNPEDHSEEETAGVLNGFGYDDDDWEQFAVLAGKSAVAGLMYDTLKTYGRLPQKAMDLIARYSQKVCRKNYRFMVLQVRLKEAFEKAGISFCVLKGIAAANDYPVPDVRKSGDIDILLTHPSDLKRALEELEELGYEKESEMHVHHVELRHTGKSKLELHTLLVEPFDNAKTNQFLEKLVPECEKHIVFKEIMGIKIPVLDDAFHAYELLMHMLQHFLLAGFGVRLLCDWVVLWNRGLSEKDRNLYMKLVQESKVKSFSDVITRVCIKYLGLKEENVLWMNLYDNGKSREELDNEAEAFVEDIMDAGEFGEAKDRMVALRGTGMFDYVREFHHQMHINFPKAGKCFLLWPVLWVITLVRFLRNNKKVRDVSSRELFKNAKKRGRLVKKLHIFE